ncbi:hypothetical protein A3K87_20655 [Variovorax paradoxus]|uniref:Uncharacterized protein n=2 Tax=Variovorax paradoxus TaxID=34073 RepID=A0AA91DND7_VARPD|nr:hypothetical protein A3K87_20655 [Variovorax paradoxus]
MGATFARSTAIETASGTSAEAQIHTSVESADCAAARRDHDSTTATGAAVVSAGSTNISTETSEVCNG